MTTLLAILFLARAPASVVPAKQPADHSYPVAFKYGERWTRFTINSHGAFYWTKDGKLGRITPGPWRRFEVLTGL